MKDKQPEQGFDLTARQATARLKAALRKAYGTPPKQPKEINVDRPVKNGRRITDNIEKSD